MSSDSTALIDVDTFKALQDSAGADFVIELVDTFLEEGPQMLGELRAAWVANDAAAFKRAARERARARRLRTRSPRERAACRPARSASRSRGSFRRVGSP